MLVGNHYGFQLLIRAHDAVTSNSYDSRYGFTFSHADIVRTRTLNLTVPYRFPTLPMPFERGTKKLAMTTFKS